MNILIYDNNKMYKNNLDEVIKFFSFGVSIARAYNYDECLANYKANSFELVIIDASEEEGYSLISYFLENFKEQRLIALATKPMNFGVTSCEYCKKYLNFKVLMRPIRQEEFIHILRDNFECEFHNLNLPQIVTLSVYKKVAFDYPFINYDKESQEFCLKSKLLDSQRLSCLVDLTRELEDQSITFIVEDLKVKILESF